MSVYGYLNCHDCRQSLWLGKALHDGQQVFCYHVGGEQQPPHWGWPELNQVVWKFLADHTGHRIDVRLEHAMTEEMFGYRDLCEASWGEYLAGWRGLSVGTAGSSDAGLGAAADTTAG